MKKGYYLVLILLLISKISFSQLISPFSPVISVTQKGDITFAANSITTCTGTGTTCTNGRTQVPPVGTTQNQTSGITIGYIDIDGSTGIGAQTFSSSSSTLDLGGVLGCGVIYAYLTWGGYVTTGTTNYAKRDSIYFQAPGSSTYNKLKADNFVDNTAPYNRTYHCYKNVTNIVKAAGPGVYTSANIVAATGGTNQFAGWTLVVIYSDPNQSLKNLTIFRGLAGVSGTTAVQFNISGFFTPPAPAPVNVKLGIIGFDGDRALPNSYTSGLAGDSLKFNGVPVNNGKNPSNDIFNSTITNVNTEYVRTPAYTNTLGYDADIISLANSSYAYLGNSASSASLRMSSGGETILTDIVTTAIDVFEPEMRFEKTYINLNGNNPAQLGDVLEYTLKVRNQGSDPADSLTVIDSLYGALVYVPGSLQIVNGPNAGAKSDAVGDDQMEFISTGNFIKARLGVGADGVNGGKINNIGPDSVTTISFRASITNDCTIFSCKDSVFNMAYATYFGQTAIQKRSTFSSANGIDPGTGCPLSGPTGLRVLVPVCALPADTAVSHCSPFILSELAPDRPGYDSYFNSSWTQVTNATTSGTYYAVKSVYPASFYLKACNDTIQINFTSTGACTLPVALLSFDAAYTKPDIELRWSTSQEINNRHFELQRSIDGLNFETIAIIPGSLQSTTVKNYLYTDRNFPKANRVYYRILQVDVDGYKIKSQVKTVIIDEFKSNHIVVERIEPNPADNYTTVFLTAANQRRANIRLLDLFGRKMFAYETQFSNGQNSITVNVDKLPAAMYLLEITDKETGKKSVHKIMVK